MKFPEAVKLVLVDKVDSVDGGGWWQHQRDDEHGVGVMVSSRGRGHHTSEEWYADAVQHRTFPKFADLAKAAALVTDKEATEVLARYPFMAELDTITNPGPGHGVPRCMVNTGQVATHVGVLVQGWFRSRSQSVFLGAAAVKKLKANKNPDFIIDALRAERQRRLES